MTRRSWGILVAVALVAAGCTPSRVEPPQPAARMAPSPAEQFENQRRLDELFVSRGAGTGGVGEYRIGPGDRIEIDVFRVNALDGVYTVDRDGTVLLPMVGELRAGGLTVDRLAEVIAARLEESYLQSPRVRASVKTFRGQPVAVLGAVVKPGFYSIGSPDNSVLDMISQAGGLKHNSATKLYLSPEGGTGSGKRVLAVSDPTTLTDPMLNDPIEIDLADLSEGKMIRAFDLPVRAGDVLFVEAAGQVVVEGWVANPRPVRIRPGLTLVQAIAEAGGLHFGASSGPVVVSRRGREGPGQSLKFNYNDLAAGRLRDLRLQDGDRIHVPANPVKVSLWAFARTVTGLVNVVIGGGVGVF